jgi:hypothetical protein
MVQHVLGLRRIAQEGAGVRKQRAAVLFVQPLHLVTIERRATRATTRQASRIDDRERLAFV